MASIKTITVGTTTYNLKDAEGRKEAYLEWGGKNFNASYGCLDAAMVPELGANRLMFAKAAGITIEYSRDNGATWTDYGATDTQKVQLFSTGYAFVLGKADSTNKATANGTNYQLRVTLATSAAQVYTTLHKFVLNVGTVGSNNCTVTIEKALESTPTTYTNVATDVPLGGWSGYNVINTDNITTYGNTASSQYGRIRFTFKANGGNTNYIGFQVTQIMGFGGNGWVTPSNMAKAGHLYSYDANQNATFPANVTATAFSGNLSGTASKATAANLTTTANAIAYYTNTTGTFGTKASANGALYSTGTNSALTFGTLPIAQGGTGKTTAADAWTALGGGASGKHADSYFALASHGNHVPTTQTANNAVFLRNDNTWQTVTPANIGAAVSTHSHGVITNSGYVGTASNKALYTGTSGVITSGTLPAAAGGTGKTNLKDAANALLNGLDTGSSTPVDADYYISQYVGGGTTTITYHRRPVSALWSYIKSKADSVYSSSTHTHGNIGNTGLMTASVTLASGDRLVVTDSSASHKMATSTISFDGSTTTKALTPKGTWETFTQGTINNAALTLNYNGTNLGSFTSNASTATTISWTGPTVYVQTTTPSSPRTGDIWVKTV